MGECTFCRGGEQFGVLGRKFLGRGFFGRLRVRLINVVRPVV